MDFYHRWVGWMDFYFWLLSLYKLDEFLPPLGWFGGFFNIFLQLDGFLPPLGWFGGFSLLSYQL